MGFFSSLGFGSDSDSDSSSSESELEEELEEAEEEIECAAPSSWLRRGGGAVLQSLPNPRPRRVVVQGARGEDREARG